MKRIVPYLLASVIVGSFAGAANADTIISASDKAILDSAVVSGSGLCADQVLYEKRTLEPTYVVEKTTTMVEPTVVVERAACPPAIIERKSSHFLRFGLGPLLDIGLF
jgi:hypothetical protein